MMFTEGQVEKPSGDTTAVETTTTTSENQVLGTEKPQEALKPEDDLDAVPEGKAVPYDRFKKVIDQKNSYKTKAEEYDKKSDQYKAYEQLDTVMRNDPLLNREVNDIIERYNKGELTKKEMKTEISEAKVDATARSTVTTSPTDEKLRKITVNMYTSEFNGLVGKDYTEKEDVQTMGAAVERELDRIYPNWRDDYNPGVMTQAYENAKKFLDNYANRRMKSYMSDKKGDSVPASKPGATPSTEKRLETRDERIKYAAEELRKITSQR